MSLAAFILAVVHIIATLALSIAQHVMKTRASFKLLAPLGSWVAGQLALPHGWFGRVVMTRLLSGRSPTLSRPLKRRVLRDNPAGRGYGEAMRVRMLLPFILSLTFVVPALPCPGAARIDPVEPGFPGQTVTADFGPPPLVPARSDSGSSTAQAASTWATPNSAIEMLPLPVEAVPVIAANDVPRTGFPPGIEHPPKRSL